jgi:hypothetical protein
MDPHSPAGKPAACPLAPRGSAFLALWNDFDPGRDSEYNAWHTFEHVPERVGIPGFLAARRYVARERDDHRYFTLYDLASLAALDGPDYRDAVERPTEWSQSMRASFRNFLRRPCETLLRMGTGMAGSIATFRFFVPADVGVSAWRASLQPQLESAGVIAIHLGRVDSEATFPLQNATEEDASAGLAHVLLVESIDRTQLDAAGMHIADLVRNTSRIERMPRWEIYDFAFAIDREGLSSPTNRRQPPRTDLRRRWID